MISYGVMRYPSAMYEYGEYFPSLERAQQLCRLITLSTQVDNIPISDSHRRILATDLASKVDDPPFDNSSMDGFAVIQADTLTATHQSPIELELIDSIDAGTPSNIHLKSGQAAAIMTGAEIPSGADSIVIIEDATPLVNSVMINAPGRPGYIRKRGENLTRDSVTLPSGTHISPREIGLAATMGFDIIPTIRRLKIAIIPTGDELIQPGDKLGPGQIHESNSFAIESLVNELGHLPARFSTISDDIDILRSNLDAAATSADLILTSGGVSMGEKDIVRKLMEEEGDIVFWRVKLRPGSPPIFGTWKGTPIFGLPGNPVSSHIVFRMLVKPWLLHITGANGPEDQIIKVRLLENVKGGGDCLTLRRIKITHSEAGMLASLPTHQGSGNMHSLVAANGLTLLPPGQNGKAGEIIDAIMF